MTERIHFLMFKWGRSMELHGLKTRAKRGIASTAHRMEVLKTANMADKDRKRILGAYSQLLATFDRILADVTTESVMLSKATSMDHLAELLASTKSESSLNETEQLIERTQAAIATDIRDFLEK